MKNLSIKMYINGKELSPEWIEAKELERTYHIIREMGKFHLQVKIYLRSGVAPTAF